MKPILKIIQCSLRLNKTEQKKLIKAILKIVDRSSHSERNKPKSSFTVV